MNHQLAGAWQLIAHKYGDATAFTDVQDDPQIHRKYITGHHFIWVTYDRQTGQILEAAGGVCAFHDNTYNETPQYGLGQSFEAVRNHQHPFTYTFQGDRLKVTGTLQLNGDEAETLMIEEVWECI